VYYTNSFFL